MDQAHKYSIAQMDNFYTKLGTGVVKSSGIMNYIQHMLIAQACTNKRQILEVCCGRGLILPLLQNYSSGVVEYMGLDISIENLEEAKQNMASLGLENCYFKYNFLHGDVTCLPKRLTQKFDAVIYTSAIEHMTKEEGDKSLEEVAKVLKDGGTLFLSTPRTKKEIPYKLQYKVHVYEWDYPEVKACLAKHGFYVVEEVGLLPYEKKVMRDTVALQYGSGAVLWFDQMLKTVPEQFLDTILASAFPENSKEILFYCQKKHA